MEMEDKESTESGSAEIHSASDSPPLSSDAGGVDGGGIAGGTAGGSGVVANVINMAVSMSMERNIVVAAATGGVVVSGGGTPATGSGGYGDLVRKKRGRPRKYDEQGNLRVPYAGTASGGMQPPGFTLTTPPSSDVSSSKRGRGRPRGSGNWQILASMGEVFFNSAGSDFIPHVLTVHAGEDVVNKVYSFVQKGPRGICILSANGSVSNVTIRQPGSSGGILTYEGRFEILNLTGSFTFAESGGLKGRTGGLSISLAGPDGRVFGGGIAGYLVAANPIQMVIGSFMPQAYKAQRKKHKPKVANHSHGGQDPVTFARPLSQAPPQVNVVANPSPHLPFQIHGELDNSGSNRDNVHSTSTDTSDWNGSDPTFDQRPSPDINLSVSVE